MGVSDDKIQLFDGFTLDLARGVLVRDGETVHLRPQTYEVLKYLAENRGRLISKDKLIEEVWQGRAVTDGSLGKCIEEVRDALGENAKNYVRNERGRGYIFEAEADGEEKTGNVSVTSEQIDVVRMVVVDEEKDGGATYIAVKARRLKIGLAVAVFFIVLLAAGALSYWLMGGRSSNSAPIESIAVMPFVNESGNPDVEYLSDGMTETLISSLSQIPKLNVKARSSVFRYKGKDTSAQTIGKELNVQAILTGRVIQRGEDLILYVELVDAATENSLWKQTYNKTMTNLVALQNDIARDVADKLKVKLSGADEQKLAKNYTENPEAYQLYLQGLYHWNKLSPSEIRKSLEYFQRAVDVDPNYALAYADEGRAYFSLALIADAPSQEVLPKAREAAVRALKIDDRLAPAHTTLGWVKFWFDWDWNGAEQEFLRALSLDPNLGDTHVAYANVLTFTGRHAEALYHSQRARELEPLNLRFNALEGQAFFYAGKYDEAIVRLQKTVELEPTFSLSHLFLSRVYSEKGMYTEAITEATKASDLSGGHAEAVALIVYALARSGKRREAQAALNELTKRAAEQRYIPPYNLALAYNGLGETDVAFDWLEKGLQQRDVRMTFLKVEPKWNNLRDDPRFQDLLRRVGLPQ